MPQHNPICIRSTISVLCAALLLVVLPCPQVKAQQQLSRKAGALSSNLQQHYDTAQRLQQSGDFQHAAQEYRIFLADVLGQLAVGQSRAGDYSKAASLFDDALVLVPNSPELLLAYARSALSLGDPAHAETLARKFIRDYPTDRKRLAQAHQILGQAFHKTNRDKDARKELEAAVALDPTFENGYALGIACLDTGDGACADQVFAEMEKSFGDTPAIHMYFGRAYGESDFQQKAISEFKKVIEEDPKFPAAHYCLAATLISVGDDAKIQLSEAEAELRKELALSPNDFLTYSGLGKVAMLRHNYADAEKYLKRATELNPSNPDAFLYLGQMYVDLGRSDDAVSALRKSIQLTTDESRNRYQVQKAHYLLGRLLMKKGDTEEAHKEMQAAQALMKHVLTQDRQRMADYLDRPDAAASADSRLALKTTSAETNVSADPEEIGKLNAFEQQVTPAVADSYNNLGAIAAMSQNYAAAVMYFKRAFQWNPDLEGLDYNWGRAAFSASQFGEAILPLSRYLRAHPEEQNIRAVLGISQFMTQDYAGCIRTLQQVASSFSSVPQVAYVYGESLAKTGQTSSAIEQLSSLEKSHPEIGDVHRALGEIYASQNDNKKAAEEFESAVKLNSKDIDAHYGLGKIQLADGNVAAAIPHLEIAANANPSKDYIHYQLQSAYRKAGRIADADRELNLYREIKSHQVPQGGMGDHSSP